MGSFPYQFKLDKLTLNSLDFRGISVQNFQHWERSSAILFLETNEAFNNNTSDISGIFVSVVCLIPPGPTFFLAEVSRCQLFTKMPEMLNFLLFMKTSITFNQIVFYHRWHVSCWNETCPSITWHYFKSVSCTTLVNGRARRILCSKNIINKMLWQTISYECSSADLIKFW